MTRHFSIPTVLRMTPNGLLARFFEHLDVTLPGIDWQQLRRSDIPAVVAAIRSLTEREQHAVDSALGDIFLLACERGVAALWEAASLSDCQGWIPSPQQPYQQAMQAYLQHPDVFQTAVLLRQVDSLSRWRRFGGLPSVSPGTTPAAMEDLRNELSQLLQQAQGRGERCTVEYTCRASGTDYFFAYPDDFVHTLPAHDDSGCLVSRSLQPTFEIVFAYTAESGVLELYARVPPKLKTELKDVFCSTVLGQPSCTDSGPAYDLNVLKDRRGLLDTDPADQVQAWVRRVTLALRNAPHRLTLDTGCAAADADVFTLIERHVQSAGVPLTQVDISSATLAIRFDPLEGRKPGMFTFNVTSPNGCTLRNEHPERAALASHYLKHWGICRA